MGNSLADERNADAAVQAALNPDAEEAPPPRPANMPDLTRGDPLPLTKDGPVYWNMGPTGIVGIRNGGPGGDQVRVISVLTGSPAEEKVLPGDVILGVGGRNFVVGGDISRLAGDAIVAAETEKGGGKLHLRIWRDRNWTKRTGPKDAFAKDLEQLFKEAEESAQLYEWKDEGEKTVAVQQMAYDEFPIDGVEMDIELRLEVMGTYSDTSPWDCPVVRKARDNALKVIAARIAPDARRRGRLGGTWPDILALVASGEPEYIALAKKWVHEQELCPDMAYKASFADLRSRGYQSWYHGFDFLEMAIYYDATGDDYVLPEIRKRAIIVAMGQNGGGSWGHTFSYPESNGGFMHRNNPGYGAMNNAGTRCFFLLTLAKKFGIEHPEIDAAIHRADRFFRTFVDKGCIPYGYHSPWPSDDSNGKNYGAAYAFHVLGRKYEAKYFAMNSANAAFTRRGGHGSWNLWYYTPFSANIAGPEAVKAHMRNMRGFYTLSRRHDGSFVFIGEQSPGVGDGFSPGAAGGMRNATATYAMLLSAPLKQLIITGKDADEKFWMTDEEYHEMLISVGDALQDPVSLAQRGKSWRERSTDELIQLLDHFYPKMRGYIADEVGRRYAAGEKDILPKLLPLLDSDEARMRAGACKALAACGKDAVLENMSKVVALLREDVECVRMQAIDTMGKATVPGDQQREELLLQAAAEDYDGMTMDNGNVRNAVKDILFKHFRDQSSHKGAARLGTSPFQAGYDEALVRKAFEEIVTMDPQGTVPGGWDKEALLKLAGPVTFSGEVRQVNDAMFGGARKNEAQALLRKFGYREEIDGEIANLRQRGTLERSMRMKVGFKDPFITPGKVKQAPGRYRDALEDLKLWLQDDPLLVLSEKTTKGNPPILTPLDKLIALVEADTRNQPGPSIRDDVFKMFETELARAGEGAAQVKLCREELKEPARKNYFRQMAAMAKLVEKLGAQAAMNDVLPYVGHQSRGVGNFARELGVDMVKAGAEKGLVAAFVRNLASGQLQGTVGIPASPSEVFSGNTAREQAVGILAVLANAGAKSALDPARQALKHNDAVIRGAAIQTVFELQGVKGIPEVFTFLQQANDPHDLWSCEKALLSRRDDPDFVRDIRTRAIALLPKATIPQRRSLAWVIGQLGGPESLDALQQAATTTEDENDLQEIIRALAYAPDRAADKTLLELAKVDATRRKIVAALSVHRMVGPNGVGDVTDQQRLDFAGPLLGTIHDERLISYLGRVHSGRSCTILLEVMKKGSTGTAAAAIIDAAEGMQNPPPEDGKAAAAALTEVIEYIEVTHLRGGTQAHMQTNEQIWAYSGWKTRQTRAGQALLKVYNPTDAPIESFDALDLDL